MEKESILPYTAIGKVEIVLTEPLIKEESVILINMFKMQGMECNINDEGRIIVVEHEEFKDVLTMIISFGLSDDIGMIRETVEYYPNEVNHNFITTTLQ